MTEFSDVKRQWDGLENSKVGRVAHKALTTAEWCALDRANAVACGMLAILLVAAVYRMVAQ